MPDTLKYVKKLEAVGISRKHAEAQVEVMSSFIDQNLATKADLRETASDIRAEMAKLGSELRSEMAELGSELRSEMADIRTEMRTEITALRSDMDVKFANFGRDFTIRFGVMLAAGVTITISTLGFLMQSLLQH
jgi:hypothetical protein